MIREQCPGHLHKILYKLVKARYFFIFFCLFCSYSINSQVNSNEFVNLNSIGQSPLQNFTLIADYLANCDPNLANLQANFRFDYGWNCKRHGDFCVMHRDRVECDGGILSLNTLSGTIYDCRLNNDDKGYATELSGGMIYQFNNMHLYGYFEAEIIMPNSRSVFPAFWLAGPTGGVAGYNEIDIMEYGVGDAVVHTSHILDPGTGFGIAQQKWNYCLPGQSFSGRAVTYSVLWDPNKIVWYVNNNPVKVVTNIGNIHPIPDVAMSIIANNQISLIGKGLDYLPEELNTEMIVNHIRVHQRQNINNGNINFTLNGQKGTLIDPILIPQQNPCTNMIKVDLLDSYLPGHNFYFRLTEYEQCNFNNGTVIEEGWITPQLIPNDCRSNITSANFNLYEFNLNQLIPCADFNNLNSCYSLLIGTRSQQCLNTITNCMPPCQQTQMASTEELFFNIVPCTSFVDFNINEIPSNCPSNGNFTECLTPIIIGDNHGKSKVIMEVVNTTTCANDYFVSVELSNASGGRTYLEATRWLTEAEKALLPFIDIEKIWATYSNIYPFFFPGQYYRVKLATNGGQNWTEKVQLIRIQGCSASVEFTLNNIQNSPNPIPISLGQDLLLDATASEFCSEDFKITIVEANNPANFVSRTFPSVEKFYFPANTNGLPGLAQYKYYQGRLNLVQELINLSNGAFRLECGKQYWVSMSIVARSGTGITCCGTSDANQLITITGCEPNSDFFLYGDWCFEDYSDEPIQDYENEVNVRLWAPEFRSYNYTARIMIEALNPPIQTNPFILDINDQDQLLVLSQSGDYNISNLIRENFGGNPALINRNYRLSLIAFRDTTCLLNIGQHLVTSMIEIHYLDEGCGEPFNKDELQNRNTNKASVDSSKLVVVPNPISTNFSLNYSNIEGMYNFEVITINGLLLRKGLINFYHGKSEKITLESLSPGIYLIKLNLGDSNKIARLVIID